MKLGIVVVYMVLPGDADLVDLHLRYIERCTRVPFTLYAAANRLDSDLRDRLTGKPYVRLCHIPETDLRSSPEHAYYLERLIATAIEDGVTHVAILHVDSFPIRPGWASDLDALISSGYAFAAIVRDELVDPKPMTAGLFFSREFYLRYRPQLRLSDTAVRSHAVRNYARTLRNPLESGTGYGFLAFKEGLPWYKLLRTNVGEDHYYFGSIYGDLIFHLGSAASESRGFPGMREHPWTVQIRQRAALMLPRGMRRLFKLLIPQRILFPESPTHQHAYSAVKKALLADPDGYLQYLRNGQHVPDKPI